MHTRISNKIRKKTVQIYLSSTTVTGNMYGILLAEFHKLLKLELGNKHQMLSRIYSDSVLKIRYIKENIYISLQVHFANCFQIQGK